MLLFELKLNTVKSSITFTFVTVQVFSGHVWLTGWTVQMKTISMVAGHSMCSNDLNYDIYFQNFITDQIFETISRRTT